MLRDKYPLTISQTLYIFLLRLDRYQAHHIGNEDTFQALVVNV